MVPGGHEIGTVKSIDVDGQVSSVDCMQFGIIQPVWSCPHFWEPYTLYIAGCSLQYSLHTDTCQHLIHTTATSHICMSTA